MLLVDLEHGRIIDDDELKAEIATAKPYQRWLDETQIKIETLPDEVAPMPPPRGVLFDRQQAFGYTQEDVSALPAGRSRCRARTRSARWGATRRSRCSPTGRSCSSTISSSASPR